MQQDPPLNEARESPQQSNQRYTEAWHGEHTKVFFASTSLLYVLLMFLEYYFHAPGVRNSEYFEHFIYQADGWLHGHLYVTTLPQNLGDYTPYRGHWYVSFPPLPAILLLPLVALFHLQYQSLLGNVFSVTLGCINIGLLLQVLKRLNCQLAEGFPPVTIAWLLIFFASGTEVLYVTMQGTTWFQAHVVATTFLLLHLGECLGKRRPWLAALYLGLASLARITTLLTFPCYLLLIIACERKMPALLWRKILVFCAILLLFVTGMLLYNFIRFGSLFNFGYTGMMVASNLRQNLQTYGLFNGYFIPTNLRYTWLQPPIIVHSFPFLIFNPFGTGLFWTTPAFLLIFLAARKRETRWLAASLLAACVLPILVLLLYYNTGWYQFGARFSMDYLPFAFLLAVLGIHTRLTQRERLLIILSVLINVWGYLVFMYVVA